MRYLLKGLASNPPKNAVKIFLGASLLSTCLIACTGKANTKFDTIIVYVAGCQDTETSSDILNSARGIKSFVKKNNIELDIDNSTFKCGYRLLSDDKRKNIDGVLTDYDLMQEASLFFLNSNI